MQLTLETLVKERFGALKIAEQLRDAWRVAEAVDTVVTWPIPVMGSQFEPIDEVLGQLIAIRRAYPEAVCTVVLPPNLVSHRPHLLFDLWDLQSAFASANPAIELLHVDEGQLSPLLSRSTRSPVVAEEIPAAFQQLARDVFGSSATPEFAQYRGSFFAEYLGIPVIGMIGDTLVAGIDPRDQAMAQETAMNQEALLSFAHDIVVNLSASRRQRSGRYDFSRVAVGRLLRSLYLSDRDDIVALEFGEVGQGRARAYAIGDGTFYGFGGGLDIWLVVEAAILCRVGISTSHVAYVLDQEPLRAFNDLARLVGVSYSIEVKELTGG